jgi:hypothetical protein
MDGLTEGRIVHYVMPSHEHRPAIVVHVWKVGSPEGVPTNNGMINLTVFVDGLNDVKPQAEVNFSPKNNETLLMRCTSVLYSEDPQPFTWHWIEKA